MVDRSEKQTGLDQHGRLKRFDSLCDRFESAWRSEKRPLIELYLTEVVESERGELLRELLTVELELRRRTNEHPTAAEYLTRFSTFGRLVADIVREAQLDSLDGDSTSQPAAPLDTPAPSAGRFSTLTEPPMTPSTDAVMDAVRQTKSVVEPKLGQFGDYELLHEIARGGMGVVYKARQTKLNRLVALKMILAGQLASEADIARFYTEAQAAAKLDHPGIVPIYEVGQRDGQHYFAMAFVDGPSLAAKLAHGPLLPRDAARLLCSIARSTHYLHQHGIVHRDLKPSNVLMGQNGEPRITDFGLAKQMSADSSLTATGQILGTPNYMAPEQASGHAARVGPPADIYSLGAILYCLLTGHPPFRSKSAMEILRQVVERDPTPIRQINLTIDREIETICHKCLQKQASDRYPTALALAEDLERYLAGETIQARSRSRWDRSLRWCRTYQTQLLISVAAAVVVLCSVGTAIYFANKFDNLVNERLERIEAKHSERYSAPQGKNPRSSEPDAVEKSETKEGEPR